MRFCRPTGAARPGETPQTPASGALSGARRQAAGRAAEPRLGAGLPVRPDRGRAGPEAAQHRRRAHAGGSRDRGRQEHHRRRHGLNARGDRRPARDGARRTSVATTGPSSRPTPCATGAGSPAQAAATSSPARRGRTHTSSRSTAGCATSSWPSSSSTACSRRRCCSRTGGSSTTRSARTAAWAGSPRLPTPSAGRLSYTLDSHKRWSRKGGPVRKSSFDGHGYR